MTGLASPIIDDLLNRNPIKTRPAAMRGDKFTNTRACTHGRATLFDIDPCRAGGAVYGGAWAWCTGNPAGMYALESFVESDGWFIPQPNTAPSLHALLFLVSTCPCVPTCTCTLCVAACARICDNQQPTHVAVRAGEFEAVLRSFAWQSPSLSAYFAQQNAYRRPRPGCEVLSASDMTSLLAEESTCPLTKRTKRQRTQGASRARVAALSESSPEGQAASSAALKAMRSSLRTPGRATSNPTKLDSTPAGVDRASACSEDTNPARPDGQPEGTRSNSGRLRIPKLGKLNIQDNHPGVNNGREHPAMLGHRAGLGQSHDLTPLEVRA